MPNWCMNTLEVKGKKKDVKKFDKDLQSDNISNNYAALQCLRALDYLYMYMNLDRGHLFGKKTNTVPQFYDDLFKYGYNNLLFDTGLYNLIASRLGKFNSSDDAFDKVMDYITQRHKQQYRAIIVKRFKYGMNNIVPTPALDNYRCNVPTSFMSKTWYGWQIDNWGTKWDFSDFYVADKQPGIMVYDFSTAWSPCIEFVERISKIYPSLKFTLNYNEDGELYAGHITYENGNVTDQEEFEGDSYAEYLRFLGYDDRELVEELAYCYDFDMDEIYDAIEGILSEEEVDDYLPVRKVFIKRLK